MVGDGDVAKWPGGEIGTCTESIFSSGLSVLIRLVVVGATIVKVVYSSYEYTAVGCVTPGTLGEGNAITALFSGVIDGPGIELLAKAFVITLTLPEKWSVAITVAIAPRETRFLHSSSDIAAEARYKRNSYRATSRLMCPIKTGQPWKRLVLTNRFYT
jgi:hypothetical protein